MDSSPVKQLRGLGFVIEMDDFGNGYSSLNMLNKMPLDILKLDMKFVQNEIAKPMNQGILRFIMELAKWMDLSVVAEGVETKEQLERLREIGCNYVQGYYFAKPMPRREFIGDLIALRYEELGIRTVAEYYLCATYHLYASWGAEGKCERMKQRYPELFKHLEPDGQFPIAAQLAISLENAYLYEHLRFLVEARAKALKEEIQVRKETEAKLAQMANHDPLTGLPNRRLFHEILSRTLLKADRNQ